MIRLKAILISLLLLIICTETFAQNLKLSNAESTLEIFGNSSLHDWKVKADNLSGEGVFMFKSDTLISIEKLTFYVQVKGLNGEKKGMKKKIISALQADKYTSVRYQFDKLNTIKQIGINNYKVKTTGNLTIAGVSRRIVLNFFITVKNNNITIVGTKKLKMTEYDIKPPKALMGLLKTGDEIKVNFNVLYQ